MAVSTFTSHQNGSMKRPDSCGKENDNTAGFGNKTLTEVIVEIQKSISGTASDDEVDDMLDDAFGSDDPGGSTESNTASDKEVDDLLNDVFG